MTLVNEEFLKLQSNYLFSDIAKKVNSFKVTHPKSKVIRMGIGDVTQPLAPAVIAAMHKAVEEMSRKETFHGYGPEQGYSFLIDSIGVTDPVYPVYIDSNVMAGRTGNLVDGKWSDVVYIPCTAENGFVPDLPSRRVDIIYLCYPNNPTGTTLGKEELKKWVNYALANDSIIMFDAAYEAYIQDPDIPHSIYEIKGAKKVAIEFRSFSKTAGFTGVRCGYTVVPKELKARTLKGGPVFLNKLWNRRQCTKFNGTSYITQRGAEAVYSPEGKEQVRETIQYYMTNAKIMREGLTDCGLTVYGGKNAPYLWVKAPDGWTSWKFFEKLLYEVNIIGTPGVGFGPCGEGYLRLTAFGDRDETQEAIARLREWTR